MKLISGADSGSTGAVSRFSFVNVPTFKWRRILPFVLVLGITTLLPRSANTQDSTMPLLDVMVGWAEKEFCRDNQDCVDLADDYHRNEVKHLGYIRILAGQVFERTGAVYFDLDDYNGITGEGQEGWVTTWGDLGVHIGVSNPIVPVGVGVVRIKREPGIDDPKRAFGIELTSWNFGIWECSGINVSTDGTVWGECDTGTVVSGGAWTLLGVNFNVFKKRVSE
jgi:hypothetical protein